MLGLARGCAGRQAGGRPGLDSAEAEMPPWLAAAPAGRPCPLSVGLRVSAHAPRKPRVMCPPARPSCPSRASRRHLSSGFQAAWCSGSSDSDPSHSPLGPGLLGCPRLSGGAGRSRPGCSRLPGAKGAGAWDRLGRLWHPRQSLMVPFPMPKPESPGWRGRGWPCCVLTWLSSPSSDAEN